MENTTIYHEIDFLLPAQRFNINFSYITDKGLPFVREFVLRLVHLAPMSMSQIAIFFGFSRREVKEAIDDLVERGDLTLSENGRLSLTEKSSRYFTELGEVPRLSLLQDSTACLSFDLATFSCLGKNDSLDRWKAGIKIKVDDENASCSQIHVEKHFQLQFYEILQKDFLSKALTQNEKDLPRIYTVDSVQKIKSMPVRLTAQFKIGEDGRDIERDDFELLRNSDYIHEQISLELANLARPSNLGEIIKIMSEIGDCDTLKIIDSEGESIKIKSFEELQKDEINNNNKRVTFIGPIYLSKNWRLLQDKLAPIVDEKQKSSKDNSQTQLIWVAPSDPYWGKSTSLQSKFEQLLSTANFKGKSIYSPVLYLPISGEDDRRSINYWKQEFNVDKDEKNNAVNGLLEGFMGGGIEMLLLEGKFAVVVYHILIPDQYSVTVPIGFITEDRSMVTALGELLKGYIMGAASFDRLNNCGPIADLVSSKGKQKK